MEEIKSITREIKREKRSKEFVVGIAKKYNRKEINEKLLF